MKAKKQKVRVSFNLTLDADPKLKHKAIGLAVKNAVMRELHAEFEPKVTGLTVDEVAS